MVEEEEDEIDEDEDEGSVDSSDSGTNFLTLNLQPSVAAINTLVG